MAQVRCISLIFGFICTFDIFLFSSCDIRYTEGVQSLNWAKIMKTITDDPEAFFETGGWTFLDPESGSENERGSDEEDSEEDEYAPTDLDDEEEDESESEYSEDVDSSDLSDDSGSGSEDGEGGESDESGKDWSDLEREAAEADRENANFEDDYSRNRGKKGGAPPPSSKR